MGRAQKLFSVHLVLLWCVREQVDIRIAGHRYLYASLVIRAQSMRRHVCRFKTGLSPLGLSFTLTFAYVHDVFYRSQLKIIEHFCVRVRSNTDHFNPTDRRSTHTLAAIQNASLITSTFTVQLLFF